MVAFVIELLNILAMIIIVDALLSWVFPNPNEPPRSLTRVIAEPLSAPARFFLPPNLTGGLDLSPLVMLLILQAIRGALIEAGGGYL